MLSSSGSFCCVVQPRRSEPANCQADEELDHWGSVQAVGQEVKGPTSPYPKEDDLPSTVVCGPTILQLRGTIEHSVHCETVSTLMINKNMLL